MDNHRIQCLEIWGGIQRADQEIETGALTASVYSSASDGRKGGDIYYFSVCNRDMLSRVAVADVAGHGEAVSNMSQWLYEALVARINSPEGNEILVELNRLATERGLKALTTAVILSFVAVDHDLYFTYAGHPPILIRRREDPAWWPARFQPQAELANLPLGVISTVDYEQERLPLASGDRLFLYTDGLIEAPDADRQFFGPERLQTVLTEAGDQPLPELKQTVLAAIRQHTGGSLAHDDITLMAMEVR